MAKGAFPRIWALVSQVPRGRVVTYGQVAEAAGYPRAARHVVWALRAGGPRLPWHRVVGSGGRILLSGAAALEQRLLLESEGVRVDRGRVDMAKFGYRFPTVI
jgi:methylated-DNA-protein-cysteine methyltransferase-like protein